MQSLYMYPEGSIWEIFNSSVSGIDLLCQEVAVGTAEIFSSMFYDTPDKKVHTISSYGAKKQALQTSINGAANEIKRYQIHEARDSEELLDSVRFISFTEDKDRLYPSVEVINQAGNTKSFSMTITE